MVDPIILYDQNERSFTTNGLGFLNDATACVVEEERNGEFELEMSYPITGKRYSDIQIRRIILAKPNPYDDPEPFRIYSISKPINGIITVNAHHISYDLSDWVCLPFICLNSKGKDVVVDGQTVHYAGVTEYFQSEHTNITTYEPTVKTEVSVPARIYDPGNALTFPFRLSTDMDVDFLWVDEEGKGSDDPLDDHRFKVLKPVTARSLLGDSSEYGILKKFYSVGSDGKKNKGEIKYNRFNIYIRDPNGSNPRGRDRDFEIRYGKNMTDIERVETSDTDYTDLFPYWKDVENENTEIKILDDTTGDFPERTVPIGRSDDDPKPLYRKYLIQDLSSEFEEQPTATTMRKYSKEYIADEGLDGLGTTTITVNFQTLSKSPEYSKYEALETVKLCDTVTIIHEGLEIEDKKKVIKTSYNVLGGVYTSIDIGDPKEELADTIAATTTNVNTNINTTDLMSTVVDSLAETVPGLSTAITVVDTIAKAAAKYVHQIYCRSTTGNPPTDGSGDSWVENDNADALNTWLIVEPSNKHEGTIYTTIQTQFNDNTITIDNPTILKAITAASNAITEVKDKAGNVIGGVINGGKIEEKTVSTDQMVDKAITTGKIADEAVDTAQIADEAVTYEKLEVNAIHSENYVAYDDEAAKWLSTKAYSEEDRVAYYDGDEYKGYFECIADKSTKGRFVETEWKELETDRFSVSGSKFDLEYGYISSENFAVDSNGDAFFRGEIKAESGLIGGWSITEDGLKSISSNYTTEFSGNADLGISSDSAIGESADNILFRIASNSESLSDSAIFAIGSDGKIYATAGYLGGWSITTDAIVNLAETESEKSVYLFGKDDPSHTFSAQSPVGVYLEKGPEGEPVDQPPTDVIFRIGSVSDATFAISKSGKLYATEGYLGPLRLTNKGLHYTSGGDAGSEPTSETLLGADEFLIKDSDVDTSWGTSSSSYFQIKKSGFADPDDSESYTPFTVETAILDLNGEDIAKLVMRAEERDDVMYAGELRGTWNINEQLIDVRQDPATTTRRFITTMDSARTYLSDDTENTLSKRLDDIISGQSFVRGVNYDSSSKTISLVDKNGRDIPNYSTATLSFTASDITSGTISAARLPTCTTSAKGVVQANSTQFSVTNGVISLASAYAHTATIEDGICTAIDGNTLYAASSGSATYDGAGNIISATYLKKSDVLNLTYDVLA